MASPSSTSNPQLTFRNTTFQTRIKRIPTKQRQQLRLAVEAPIPSIVVAQSLELRDTAYGLSRAGLDVIDVVVVEDAEIRSFFVGAATAGVGHAFYAFVSVRCTMILER